MSLLDAQPGRSLPKQVSFKTERGKSELGTLRAIGGQRADFKEAGQSALEQGTEHKTEYLL